MRRRRRREREDAGWLREAAAAAAAAVCGDERGERGAACDGGMRVAGVQHKKKREGCELEEYNRIL